METCKTCKYKTTRKIFTGPQRRYDYDYQNICSFGLKKISGYAKVININEDTCENHKG